MSETFTLLIGPPRSGTTLIANSFMSHPKVNGVIEPYQRRRNSTIGATDLSEFIEETGITNLAARPNIAMKETTTRRANVEMSLKLMKSASTAGLYTALILILRCPLSAYLSQVEASREMWREKKMTEVTLESFEKWMNAIRTNLRLICDHGRAQHFRVVSYEAFCARTRPELARLMSLVPLPLYESQFALEPPSTITTGGDPKSREKSGRIEVSNRSEQIDALIERFEGSTSMAFAQALRKIVLTHVCHESDRAVLDRLTRLLA